MLTLERLAILSPRLATLHLIELGVWPQLHSWVPMLFRAFRNFRFLDENFPVLLYFHLMSLMFLLNVNAKIALDETHFLPFLPILLIFSHQAVCCGCPTQLCTHPATHAGQEPSAQGYLSVA